MGAPLKDVCCLLVAWVFSTSWWSQGWFLIKGPITGIVCILPKMVGINEPNSFHAPYIYSANPIVVNMNQPITITKNPPKKNAEPSMLFFFEKNTNVCLGPIMAMSPRMKDS